MLCGIDLLHQRQVAAHAHGRGAGIQSTYADTGNGTGVDVGAYPRAVVSGALALAGEVLGATTVSNSTWCTTGARRDPAGTGTAQIFKNGTVDASAACVAFTNAGTPAIRIGLRDDGTLALDGDIACVVAWNRALTAPEVTQVNAYFTARFGL